MAQTYSGKVRDGKVEFDPGITPPAEGQRVEVVAVEEPAGNGSDPLASTRAWLLAFAREVETEAEKTPLPSDLAENHDHYAHGRPRP